MALSEILEIIVGVTSVVLLIVGFRKNDRRLMLIAWICLLVAVLLEGAVQGFAEGFAQGWRDAGG